MYSFYDQSYTTLSNIIDLAQDHVNPYFLPKSYPTTLCPLLDSPSGPSDTCAALTPVSTGFSPIVPH
jgi:hypothetical protein